MTDSFTLFIYAMKMYAMMVFASQGELPLMLPGEGTMLSRSEGTVSVSSATRKAKNIPHKRMGTGAMTLLRN